MLNCERMRTAARFLFLFWAGWMSLASACAEMESVRSIRVHGEAEDAVPIDRAVVEFALVSEGKTPGETERKDEARFTEVRRQVDAGLGGKGTWRTSEVRLQPILVEEKGKREGKERIAAYRVTRREAVELVEFSRIGELLSILFAAGVDEVAGVEWLSDRLETFYRELLAKALAKAKEKAELLAKGAAAQLGPVLSIQEGGEPLHPLPRLAVGMSPLPGGQNALAPVPISGGEMKIRASVQVVYRLW